MWCLYEVLTAVKHGKRLTTMVLWSDKDKVDAGAEHSCPVSPSSSFKPKSSGSFKNGQAQSPKRPGVGPKKENSFLRKQGSLVLPNSKSIEEHCKSKEAVSRLKQVQDAKKPGGLNEQTLLDHRLNFARQQIDLLDVCSASASVEEDRVRILRKIEALPGGAEQMNDLIRDKLKKGLDVIVKMVARIGL